MDDPEIIRKIKLARKHAKKHLRTDQAEDIRLVDDDMNFLPPRFFVEFPGPDTMRCTPSIMGRPAGIWFEYRLSFYADGSMAWTGHHPFYPWIELARIKIPQ